MKKNEKKNWKKKGRKQYPVKVILYTYRLSLTHTFILHDHRQLEKSRDTEANTCAHMNTFSWKISDDDDDDYDGEKFAMMMMMIVFPQTYTHEMRERERNERTCNKRRSSRYCKEIVGKRKRC